MSRNGVNMAVTADGESYNLLRRPDDFVAALSSGQPTDATRPALPPITKTSKRKLDADGDSDPDTEPANKRSREEGHYGHSRGGSYVADPRRVNRPVGECGMQSMFPELDNDDFSDETTDEALAYLHSVR
jgi:hypothetical protein